MPLILLKVLISLVGNFSPSVRRWVWVWGCLLLLLSCSNNDVETVVDTGTQTTYKLAVICPSDKTAEWKNAASYATENIAAAQKGLTRKVSLQLEWIDEDAADLSARVEQIAQSADYAAIIGPFSSRRAKVVAEKCYTLAKDNNTTEAEAYGCAKPMIVPMAGSVSFQRFFSSKRLPGVWNLCQSDMIQCETLLAQAKLSGKRKVELIAPNDDYGESFCDWFAYQATELGLQASAPTPYNSVAELRERVRLLPKPLLEASSACVIFAPGNEEQALEFDKAYIARKEEISAAGGQMSMPSVLCSGSMHSAALAKQLKADYEGIAHAADPSSGFTAAYKSKFSAEPSDGTAHFYDALLLAAYSLATYQTSPVQPNSALCTLHSALNSAILSAVDGRGEAVASWLPVDMHQAFAQILLGKHPDLKGVTGSWTFDERSHTSTVNNIFEHWRISSGELRTIEYLSPEGTGQSISTLQAWDVQTTMVQEFKESAPDISYPAHQRNWAVVVGASDKWADYRHQADALAMYQLLKRHGYTDDNIVYISEDNLAYHHDNVRQGDVRVRPTSDPKSVNLYHDITVDYKLSEMNAEKLRAIFHGDADLKSVIRPTKNDNIIVFWSGHGTQEALDLNGGKLRPVELRRIFEGMAGSYRRVLFVLEACYSGAFGMACEGLPGVLFMTAANGIEESQADRDMLDPEMQLWLSNGFARAFQETVDATPSISLRDLYYTVAAQTTASHASVYNEAAFGNLFRCRMTEWLE